MEMCDCSQPIRNRQLPSSFPLSSEDSLWSSSRRGSPWTGGGPRRPQALPSGPSLIHRKPSWVPKSGPSRTWEKKWCGWQEVQGVTPGRSAAVWSWMWWGRTPPRSSRTLPQETGGVRGDPWAEPPGGSASGGGHRSHLLARRMLTWGELDSGSGTQSGWTGMKSSAWSWSSLKQHTPTEGPTTTRMLSTRQPNSVTMLVTVAMATPSRVPFQPEEEEEEGKISV